MLIKFGSIVVGGRGKMGGQVYSHNRGGDYAKNNAIPTNPQSPTQMASRALLGLLSQAWSALTRSEINAWNNAVDNFPRKNVWGDTRHLSGKNLFTGLNKNLMQVGGSKMSNPPTPQDVPGFSDIDPKIDTSADTIDLQETVEGSTSGVQIQIVATPALSQGTSFVKNKHRVIHHDSAGSYDKGDAYSAYVARFGTPSTGDNIFVGAYFVNSVGERSVIAIARATIV